ncbi:hypothetical protein LG943_04795 [Streptomonospora sp. S1-112]|uniref:Secreted protein n=1 Tax=Streptomonospora mangrovi TaxID=2883123 RepID=A0A9X3SDB9_9ACTN|nr:hypothetical protein [Streptomonospora mangrovi]MDA0563652.1 hypothetical protein [Streptomonospora mangrovi]
MSTGLIIAIVVIVLLVAAVAVAVAVILPRQRTRHLRQRFGPEYDRAVQEHGSRAAAERELAAREKKHAQLDLKPLSEPSRRGYETGWARIQEQFVDTPAESVREAHDLLTRLMTERGYPTEDDDRRIAALSVEHAGTLDRYREARAISRRTGSGEASTEDMRNAMVHYRALFTELLANGTTGSTPADAAGRSAHDRPGHGTGHHAGHDAGHSPGHDAGHDRTGRTDHGTAPPAPRTGEQAAPGVTAASGTAPGAHARPSGAPAESDEHRRHGPAH